MKILGIRNSTQGRKGFYSYAFFVRKGIPFIKKCSHFIAEYNAFANENIDGSMSFSL